jgi:putative DNA primase/helicase
MTDKLDQVREVMAAGEEIDLDGVDLPFDPGAPSEPPPPEDALPSEPPPEARCVAFPLNDIGNGMRVVEHFGQDIFWVPRVGWFTWTGKVWAKDQDEIAVRRLAQKVSALVEAETRFIEPPRERDRVLLRKKRRVADRIAEIEVIPDEERSDDVRDEHRTLQRELKEIVVIEAEVKDKIGQRLRHAKNAGNSGPIKNMLGEAAVNLTRTLEELDAGVFDVNTESGLLRFDVVRDPDGGMSPVANVALVEHAREQLVTKMMPVVYDAAAQAPRFEAFLARIQPDPVMRAFLQRWFGLSMTAHTGEQKLAFLHGAGANGKSVLVDLMAKIIGDYAATAKIESLTGQNRRGGGDATPDLVPLMGARLVRASEPDEGERLQEGVIKELTGGEPILVRALHSDFVEVRPVFKLTISGNHKPEIRGTDDGIWRRVLLVPFDVQIPKEERDPDLGRKLWEERLGILNWLVDGLMAYLEGGLQEPQAVLDATREFREESDPVGAFLTECAVMSGSDKDFMTARELIEAFNYWLDEKGETKWGGRTVSNHLSRKAGRWRHPESGRVFIKGKSGVTGYRGVMLTDVFRARFDKRDQGGFRRSDSAGEEGF